MTAQLFWIVYFEKNFQLDKCIKSNLHSYIFRVWFCNWHYQQLQWFLKEKILLYTSYWLSLTPWYTAQFRIPFCFCKSSLFHPLYLLSFQLNICFYFEHILPFGTRNRYQFKYFLFYHFLLFMIHWFIIESRILYLVAYLWIGYQLTNILFAF